MEPQRKKGKKSTKKCKCAACKEIRRSGFFQPCLNEDCEQCGYPETHSYKRGVQVVSVHPAQAPSHLGAGHKKENEWVEFLKAYSAHHKIRYNDAMKLSTNGGLRADYIAWRS